MKQISGIAGRRALLAAALAFTAGCVIVAWTLAGALARQGQPPAPMMPAEAAAEAQAGAAAPPEEQAGAPAQPDAQPTAAPIVVYVSGAVAAPDVYRLPAEARVADLVAAAGGLRLDADAAAVNLAARLEDAEHVHVPAVGEAPAAPAAGQGAAAGGPVDINTATAAQLDELPGVGPTVAARIVAYREANGPFASVQDLQSVQGVGPALLEKIAGRASVGP